jgi:hypothetical protein
MDLLILVGTLFLCFAIGMPISYSLGVGALAGALWIGIPPEAVMLKISDGVSKVAMLTIPFFVLAGAIMAEGGMARRLVAFANVLVGVVPVRGGLSVVNILATTFLSGISGSSVADTSAIGSVMIPQMEKVGYPRPFATNVTISASVQAILVPPSHNAVIYSLATGGTISIISLFMAGIVPGLILGFALVLLCLFIAYRDGHPKGDTVPLRDAVRITVDATWGLITIVIILRHLIGNFHCDRSGGDGLCLGLLRHNVRLSRLSLARPAGAGTSHAEDGGDGHDANRDGFELWLRHGADAATGDDHLVLSHAVEQQIRDPDADQRDAPGTRLFDGHGAAHPDLHADPAACRGEARRRSGALRHDYATQPRHRPADAARRFDAVRRLRRWQR